MRGGSACASRSRSGRPRGGGNVGCGRSTLKLGVDTATAWDLTVFKVHFGLLTLKGYPKGARVRRPVPAVSASVATLVGVRLDDEEHGVDLVPARELLVRGRAQGDQPAALAQQAVRAVKHGTADRVDDDVEPGRGRAGLSGPGADEAFRAEVPHQAGVRAAPGGGDGATEDRRELDGEHADAAGAALDQHLLAGVQGRVVRQRLPGGQRRERQRRRCHVGDRRKLALEPRNKR